MAIVSLSVFSHRRNFDKHTRQETVVERQDLLFIRSCKTALQPDAFHGEKIRFERNLISGQARDYSCRLDRSFHFSRFVT